MRSKTFIGKRLVKKTNTDLVETILNAKKKESWIKIAEIISGPRRKRVDVNLSELSNFAEENEVIVVPGKVLSQGNIDKKIKVVALGFSESAREKLLSSKCEALLIAEEIKKNPEGKNIRIYKK